MGEEGAAVWSEAVAVAVAGGGAVTDSFGAACTLGRAHWWQHWRLTRTGAMRGGGGCIDVCCRPEVWNCGCVVGGCAHACVREVGVLCVLCVCLQDNCCLTLHAALPPLLPRLLSAGCLVSLLHTCTSWACGSSIKPQAGRLFFSRIMQVRPLPWCMWGARMRHM